MSKELSITKVEDFPKIMEALAEPLHVDSIEFRIMSISKNGWATILAYKDARVDMNRLDEVVGRGFWQRSHYELKGNMFCAVSIWNPLLGQFVSVSDCGVPSASEGEKGESSDSFKRAGFNLGIGRELYDMPLILVQLNDDEFTVEGNKGKATWNLKLKEWNWNLTRNDEGEVGEMVAYDQNGVERFKFPRSGNKSTAPNQGKREQKPWYDDFEQDKDSMVDKIADGERTPSEIIKNLETRFRLSKKTKDQINDLIPH